MTLSAYRHSHSNALLCFNRMHQGFLHQEHSDDNETPSAIRTIDEGSLKAWCKAIKSLPLQLAHFQLCLHTHTAPQPPPLGVYAADKYGLSQAEYMLHVGLSCHTYHWPPANPQLGPGVGRRCWSCTDS